MILIFHLINTGRNKVIEDVFLLSLIRSNRERHLNALFLGSRNFLNFLKSIIFMYIKVKIPKVAVFMEKINFSS